MPRFYGDRIFALMREYVEALVMGSSRVKVKLSMGRSNVGDGMKEVVGYVADALEKSESTTLEFGRVAGKCSGERNGGRGTVQSGGSSEEK